MAKEIDHKSRAHAFLSASSSERWMHCPMSASMAARYPAQDTVFTQEGTQAHETAEKYARHLLFNEELPAFPPEIPEDMKEYARGYAEYIQSQCDENTTVMLESRVDFGPWVPEGFGTADCILLSGDTMNVIDYKYGQGVSVSAEKNPQMILYGLGAYNDYGFVYDVKKIRLHIYQPRKDNISVYELSLEDLLLYGKELNAAAINALSDNPHMRAGDWCKFCPHGGKCPELAYFCIFATNWHSELCPEAKTLTPDAVAHVLSMVDAITAWVKKVKETALTDLINGKDIPGYKVVEGKLDNRKWSDEIKVAKVLEEAGYELDKYTTLELLSPAAMDKSIGKKQVAELLEGLIDRAPGAPTIVPETDKRPKLDRLAQAQDDFK